MLSSAVALCQYFMLHGSAHGLRGGHFQLTFNELAAVCLARVDLNRYLVALLYFASAVISW